jgi:lipocalin
LFDERRFVMSDRRILLGAGAVIVGVGSALLSGAGAAAADTADTDTGSTAATAPAETPAGSTSGAKARRSTTRSKDAAPTAPSDAVSAASSETAQQAPAARGTGRVSPERVRRVPKNTSPVADSPSSSAPVVSPSDSVSEAAPAPALNLEPAIAQAAAPAAAAPRARAAQVVASVTAAPAVPAAYVPPAPAAPAAGILLNVLSSLGWRPGSDLVAAFPALAAWANPRQSSTPAAVVGTPTASAAPPDPTPFAAAAASDPLLPGTPNGVSGVQVGHSRLAMPGAFFGDTVAADWYFPTQPDGTVDAQGVIWLQHGFAASNTYYSALAIELAQKTNSIVVAPTLTSIPFTFSGGCLICSTSQEAAAQLFLDPTRAALTESAVAAGYTGNPDQLQGAFVLSGHSAGGGFASATAADYIDVGSDAQDADLLGVVMFDGVSNGTFDGTFDSQLATLAGVPVYQLAAPAQAFNLFGATTNALLAARPDQYDGAVLVGGSHVDSMLGTNPIIDFAAQLVTKFSPAGSTAAVYNLSTGWINDLYVGATPQAPQYGLYSAANGQIIMGNTAAVSLPTQYANNLSPLDTVLKGLIDAVGSIFGLTPVPPVNTGDNGVTAFVTPPLSNGVTGVRTGSASLLIPSGENGYNAPADWYFPTQADGSVQANGIIWLQHGFLGFNTWYADMAQALAQETNSVVVAPNIFWFDPAFSGEAAADMFVGDRAALNISANAAGYEGMLPQTFILTGHSAGGRFATAAGAGTVANGAAEDLLGVVMFDGVSGDQFATQLAALESLGIPDYQIAAPPQRWNAWGRTTQALTTLYPDQFNGVQIDDGSHTDVIGGQSLWGWLGVLGSDLIVKPSPPGGKLAVRTFATGWINDLYNGSGPTDPVYGIYGNPNDGTYVPNQALVMGEAGATTLPAPPPVVVDPTLPDNQNYLGKWYEQGSVKMFFSIGLVNTTATYSLNPDNSIKVENAGNYFGPNGPSSTITGSAVPVTDSNNTRLNVGFFFGQPNDTNPGNYWILDFDPDYAWAIVGDANGTSGYILTREQTIDPTLYDALVARAYQLGVKRNITPTAQYPPAPAASLPGPAALPASARV